MTREEAIDIIKCLAWHTRPDEEDVEQAIKVLEQQPCEMTVNEYRNRLMDAFHNADCDELIAVVVRPEESEFKQLEWLLKNHYHKQKQQPCEDWYDVPSNEMTLEQARQAVKDLRKKLAEYLEQKPCEDAISRHDALNCVTFNEVRYRMVEDIKALPSVTPKEKTGKWIIEDMFDGDVAYRCSECNELFWIESGTPKDNEYNFCPNCGARMVSE